jgi:hypothetical protein
MDPAPIKLHLVTQDDQPYGSVRRCCERCGEMVQPAPWTYTDEYAAYAKADGKTPGINFE